MEAIAFLYSLSKNARIQRNIHALSTACGQFVHNFRKKIFFILFRLFSLRFLTLFQRLLLPFKLSTFYPQFCLFIVDIPFLVF